MFVIESPAAFALVAVVALMLFVAVIIVLAVRRSTSGVVAEWLGFEHDEVTPTGGRAENHSG